MNCHEADAAGLICDVLIVWAVDDQGRRYTLRHLECEMSNRTLCGRLSSGWMFEAVGLKAVVGLFQKRSQGMGTGLCSECVRRFLELEFAEGAVPT